MNKLNFGLMLLLLLLQSCKPESLLDCINSSGPVREEKRILPAFSLIRIETNIDVNWHQSNENYAIVRCGRNLHRKIKLEVSEGYKLLIANENTCNWVRDYSKTMEVDLYCPSPDYISIVGYGDVNFLDTLRKEEIIIQHYGASKVSGNIKAKKISLDFASSSNLSIGGQAENGWIQVQNFGQMNCKNLEFKSLTLEMKGQNDVQVNVNEKLNGFSTSDKDIYLKGNPEISLELKAKGKILPISN